jgi:nicotinate dehydrogenase subunit A
MPHRSEFLPCALCTPRPLPAWLCYTESSPKARPQPDNVPLLQLRPFQTGLTPIRIRNTFGLVATIALKVNGQSHTVDLDPSTPLLYALSDDLALRGPKFGCGLGQCGSCTVIINGQAVRSCITPVQTVAGSEIITLEGIGTADKPHPLQQAFIDQQAAQCGFCLNAVIMTAKAFLDKNPQPTEAQLQQAFSGVLCRCFTHARMFRAIQKASKEMEK